MPLIGITRRVCRDLTVASPPINNIVPIPTSNLNPKTSKSVGRFGFTQDLPTVMRKYI